MHLYIYNEPIDVIRKRYNGKLNTLVLLATNQSQYQNSIISIGQESMSKNPRNIIVIISETIFNCDDNFENIKALGDSAKHINSVVIYGNEASTDFLSTNKVFMNLFSF
jgi:hypothetical protein